MIDTHVLGFFRRTITPVKAGRAIRVSTSSRAFSITLFSPIHINECPRERVSSLKTYACASLTSPEGILSNPAVLLLFQILSHSRELVLLLVDILKPGIRDDQEGARQKTMAFNSLKNETRRRIFSQQKNKI